MDILDRLTKSLEKIEPIKAKGKIDTVLGLVYEISGIKLSIGDMCVIDRGRDKSKVLAEVVGFKDDKILAMALGVSDSISPKSSVETLGEPFTVKVSDRLVGRVLDGLGQPLDDKGPIIGEKYPIYREPPHPLLRKRVTEPLSVGVRAIDGLLTIGKGQRMGIFAGSGVGKSTLLGMIARNTVAEVNVIALIGERGKEVRDFIERDLKEEGLSRSVVVVVTSDQEPLLKVKGALVATAIAEFFRDLGKDVLFMMDSVTRFAMAQREVGLAIGEPSATKGYTPSVFSLLPKLLERAGRGEKGSITALYTVLVEGDDMNEPIADAVRSILDGHIVLSRAIASRNHYPAIDILSSVSRAMIDIVSKEHVKAAGKIREILEVYRTSEDLINIGAYSSGSNPKIDRAISMIDEVNSFLRQGIDEKAPFDDTLNRLMELASKVGV